MNTTALYRGKRNYELSNHLGNFNGCWFCEARPYRHESRERSASGVNVVLSDKRKSVCDEELGVEYFVAEVLSAVDYYPFGMLMPDRQWYADSDSGNYRFAFNGKEIDREHGGAGKLYDYGFRIYNPALGKFLSVDPLTSSYPWYTPYQFAGNKPVWAVDLDGLEEYLTSSGELIGKYGNSTEIRIVFDKYVGAAKDIVNNQNSPGSNISNNILYNKGSAGVFTNPDDAAADWGIRYNKNSIEDKKEFSSFIFVTKINGKSAISYTLPDIGDESSSISAFKPNKYSKPIATIHSHGNYLSGYDNNNFSIDYYDENGVFQEGDIGNDDRLGIMGYLTTPNGSLQKHMIFSKPETIRCDMPYDSKDPTTRPDQISSEHELKVD